ERGRSEPRLQRPGPGHRRLAVAHRAAVLCLVVVGEKTLPSSRALDGDDGRCARLYGGATPATPAMGATTPDRAAAHAAPNATANLAWVLPTLGRHASRPCDGTRSRARPDRRPQ